MSILSVVSPFGRALKSRTNRASPRAAFAPSVAAAFLSLIATTTGALAQNWTLTSAPLTNWSCVASSADGSKLVAAVNGGLIYASTNSGATWTPTGAPAANWSRIASSADGSKLVALVPYGTVDVSTDSGATWTDRNPGDGWVSFAESANGGILALVGAMHYFSFSTNSGTTWSEEVGLPRYSDVWSILACSADGERLAIVDNISTIPTSSDVLFISHSGGTNIAAGGGGLFATNEPFGYCNAIACSADGTKVSALFENPPSAACAGAIYSSLDWGVTWTSNCAPVTNWTSLACSADGTRQVAVGTGSEFYTSTNAGAAWTATTVPSNNWTSVASSADGAKLVAAANGGGIYTWQTAPAPILTVAASQKAIILFWTVPSVNFSLQENQNLKSANWADVPDSPALDYSTLRNQVIIPAPPGTMFYRLVSR